MNGDNAGSFAERVARGAVAFMAAATVAATVVGFWLSYAGLHAFALRSGLRGAEAWAWPASVDLFILAGELGITISSIGRKKDWMAWVYLLAGFGPSVAFNVLHVASFALGWGRYAVAAVPPVAAMLALAALMRQVYRLAVAAHIASAAEAVPGAPVGAAPDTPPGAAPEPPAGEADALARGLSDALPDTPADAPPESLTGAAAAPTRALADAPFSAPADAVPDTSAGSQCGADGESGWPDARDMTDDELIKRTRLAVRRWERSHAPGDRLPASRLRSEIQVRIGRKRAGGILAEVYRLRVVGRAAPSDD